MSQKTYDQLAKIPKDLKSAWVSQSTHIKKPWGTEVAWSSMLRGFNGKLLNIDAGEMTSLKYYETKDETLFLLSGKVVIQFGNEATVLNSDAYPYETIDLKVGDAMNIQSGCPYRIIAQENSQLIEISNVMRDLPVYMRDQSVRIKDKYGRLDKADSE